MTFYPVVYPIHMGNDDDVLLFGDLTDSVQEAAYDTCHITNQTILCSTASTARNISELSSSYPTSTFEQSPIAEMPQTFQSQSSVNSPESLHHSQHGSIGEDEAWRVDCDGLDGKLSASTGFETFNIQQLDLGRDTPSAPDPQETHNNLVAYTPFDFVPRAHPPFDPLIDDSLFLEDPAGFWAPHYIVQGSSFNYSEQGLNAIHRLTLGTSSHHSTTSTATQTSDDLVFGSSSPQECLPTTQSSPIMTKTNVTRQGSRNFPCNIDGCTRSYTRKFELSRHLKRHSGSKEHHCRFSTCAWAAPNGFARKDHLKQHLRQVHKTSA